ncbi:MAG: phosphoglycerate dehydrogenase, partial [Chloroflexi bacterium]|nr:phosphoglycerate dehydrogenase [Chloroflexota bacterium]
MELKSCRVLVTPTSYGKNDLQLWTELEALVGEVVRNTFGRPLTAGETRGLIKGCDGYIAGLDTIDRAAIEAADRLKIIARYGVGVDGVDLDAAKERSIIVTNTPFANSVSVAELAIGLLFSLARSIPSAVATTKAGQWARPMGITLAGKTVGVIGLGAIGKQV